MAEPDPVMILQDEERRSEARRRVLLIAKCETGDPNKPVPCVVRDLSGGGGKLILPTDVPLPDEFVLNIPDLSARVRVQVVWRIDKSLGVRFLGPP